MIFNQLRIANMPGMGNTVKISDGSQSASRGSQVDKYQIGLVQTGFLALSFDCSTEKSFDVEIECPVRGPLTGNNLVFQFRDIRELTESMRLFVRHRFESRDVTRQCKYNDRYACNGSLAMKIACIAVHHDFVSNSWRAGRWIFLQ